MRSATHGGLKWRGILCHPVRWLHQHALRPVRFLSAIVATTRLLQLTRFTQIWHEGLPSIRSLWTSKVVSMRVRNLPI
jgi:hypothetical protein